jgi:hypothetical protein
MDFANFWFPIVGSILLGGFSAAAWYAGHKIAGLWFGFAGAVCLLLLATLQIQRAISDQLPESSDRPRVGVDNIEMIPLQAGRNIDVNLKLEMPRGNFQST